MATPIALILGSGKGVGSHVAQHFLNEGYRVAISSRSVKSTERPSDASFLSINSDMADPKGVEAVYSTLRQTWGDPSVVVYNAYAHKPLTLETALDIPTEVFQQHLAVNTTSTFVAAREALNGFRRLGQGNFFYTGNYLVWHPAPKLLTLGLGKTASAHLVEVADSVGRGENMRFYFVDERQEDGGAMWNGVNADAHADFIGSLVKGEVQKHVPWKATFVKGKGYVKFNDDVSG